MYASRPQFLELSGHLEPFKSFQTSPCIGTEFPDVNLVDWLRASNSDEIIRDLAITIAQRGVVFFRAQTQLNDELQKELVLRLGQLSGRPKENGLYKHPFGRIFGELDPEVSGENCGKKTSKNTSPRIQSWTRLSNIQGVFQKSWTALKRIAKTLGCTGAPTLETPGKEQSGRQHWHSDITFEQNPSDFSSLKLTQLPKNGAETLWASGYGLYESLLENAVFLLENLTATHSQLMLAGLAKALNKDIFKGSRGSPENTGTTMEAVHPMVRTHPVTGWKSVFAAGMDYLRDNENENGLMLDEVVLNEVATDESKLILDKLMSMITERKDIQVRFRWENPSDMAIWDNRCTYYASMPYYNPNPCSGSCVLGVGEKPYLDPRSKSRAEALAGTQLRAKSSVDSFSDDPTWFEVKLEKDTLA